MKKTVLRVAAICSIAAILPLSSCIGSFKLTNRLLTWNNNIGNKFLNELVFIAFWILPVYEVSGLADILVLNSIEFWSGSNPMAKGKSVIEGQDGRYLVDCDGKGYTITGPDGVAMRLDFDDDTREWSTVVDGRRVVFMTFIDDTHVKMPCADGISRVYEVSPEGLYAYKADATRSLDLAVR